jgi:hypothetical protein
MPDTAANATTAKPASPKSRPSPRPRPHHQANEILAAAKAPTATEEQIIKSCEDFLANFPEPKYSIESEKLLELLALYVPLDEKRLTPPRDNARKLRAEELDKRKKTVLAEQEEKRRHDEIERERNRVAQERKLQDERKRLETERSYKDYSNRLEADRSRSGPRGRRLRQTRLPPAQGQLRDGR